MSIRPATNTASIPQIPLGQNNPLPSAGFSTESCFLWLHRKNTAFSMNIRGMVNHEYNRLLVEKGLLFDLIPGGEDFHQLGMDIKTPIVRPDLYFAACDKVISVHTGTPFDGLNLSTAAFFDLLHGQNVKCSANVRGLVNQRYNQLLSEAGINHGKIPDNGPKQLGMDKSTPLRAEFYAKAYGQVIVDFEYKLGYSDPGPFQLADIFTNTIQFMGCSDFGHCAQVCKVWNCFSKRDAVWPQLFKGEGIPFVEQIKEQPNNYEQEFRILYTMTISRKMSERLFGNSYEEIPCISRAVFNKCYQEDPFESGKLMMHTFKVVVIPAFFKRTSCAAFPFILDRKGNLHPTRLGEWTGEKLTILNNIPNLKILCEYPHGGRENMPVFSYFLPEILKKCNTCSDKIRVIFMRTCIADESRNKPYPNQEALLEGRGFGVTSLRDRIFFDAVCILTSGTCPDVCKPPRWSYARTSDIVVVGNSSHQLGIGVFAPGSGASVDDYSGYVLNPRIGVVPGVPAEVPR